MNNPVMSVLNWETIKDQCLQEFFHLWLEHKNLSNMWHLKAFPKPYAKMASMEIFFSMFIHFKFKLALAKLIFLKNIEEVKNLLFLAKVWLFC